MIGFRGPRIRDRSCRVGRHFRWDDTGSVSVELTLLTPLLIILLLFIVFCARTVDTSLRVNDVAHQAARAASLARNTSAAIADARSTAESALASAGITCRTLTVDTDTRGLQPGSTVTVVIGCSVGLGDLSLLGVPGSTTIHASSSSPIDVYRGSSLGFTNSETSIPSNLSTGGGS